MLPSLKGLEALSAFARTGSLELAAKMLGVTRSAVSHRIADLEHQLGVGLVQAIGRRTALTDDAEALVKAMGDTLERIEGAVEPIRRRRAQIRITSVATFASHWLLPRLSGFHHRHADIKISPSTSRRAIDLEKEDFDCAIRHGRGGWPGLDAALIFQETLAPVSIKGRERDLNGPAIIRARSRFRDWSAWWTASGRTGGPNEGGLVVDTRAQALEAALAGAGVAMIDLPTSRPISLRED